MKTRICGFYIIYALQAFLIGVLKQIFTSLGKHIKMYTNMKYTHVKYFALYFKSSNVQLNYNNHLQNNGMR